MDRLCLNRCGILPRCAIYFLPLLLHAAGSPNPPLTLRVASESAPAGSWAQIKVYSAAPLLISQGTIVMDLDPAVFGQIAGVAVFSASGDATGYANVMGQHVEAHFSAISGGIGQLPDVPVFALRVPVLATAAAGAKTAVTLDPGTTPWTDPQGTAYSVSVVPGDVTVQGTLSVQNVTPGGGLLPAGAVIRIDGSGFDARTTVSIDGASLSAPRLVSAQQMEVTLGGATELTGRRVSVKNAAGESLVFFPALPSAPVGTPPPQFAMAGFHLIPSLRLHSSASAFGAMFGSVIGILNQTLQPVDVRVLERDLVGRESVSEVTIAPGTLQFMPPPERMGSANYEPSAPVRAVQFGFSGLPPAGTASEPPPAEPLPPVTVQASNNLAWEWQTGSPAPAAQQLTVHSGLPALDDAIGFAVSVSAAPWLTVSPLQGSVSGTTGTSLTAAVNPVGLSPGTYTATVTLTPIVPASLAGSPSQPTAVTATLNVSGDPKIFANPGTVSFSKSFASSLDPQPIAVTSNGNPVPFTASVSTVSGGNWLSVTPSSATAPGQVTLAVDSTGLADGKYSGMLTINWSFGFLQIGVLTVPVSLTIDSAAGPQFHMSASPIQFLGEAGSPSTLSASQGFTVNNPGGPLSAPVQTDSGGNWLSSDVSQTPGGSIVSVTVRFNSTGLAAGTYHGTVNVSCPNGSGQVPVTLTLLPKPDQPPAVTPSSITITTAAGVDSDPQPITVNSPGGPALFTAGPQGLGGTLFYSSPATTTPANVLIGASGKLFPGVYHSNFVVSSSGGSVTVPVTIYVTAGTGAPPAMAALTNAATIRSGAISPGEIIALLGSGIGPPPTNLQLDAGGKVSTTLGDTQLLINGIPAPLTYAAIGQLNAVVPYEAGTSGTATLQVVTKGLKSDIWEVPLAPAAPGIFTLSGTGIGKAAVLNGGSSVNDPSNPALRGNFIQIYGTGEGELFPPGVTGGITADGDFKKPLLDVRVTIGGVDAPVLFAGSAPELVAGVLAINAIVPQEVTPGAEVPLVVTIGGIASPPATIAIQ